MVVSELLLPFWFADKLGFFVRLYWGSNPAVVLHICATLQQSAHDYICGLPTCEF